MPEKIISGGETGVDRAALDAAIKWEVPEYAPPRTIEEAVDFLMKGLSLKDKVIISRLSFEGFFALYPTLGQFIRNDFRLWTGNDELLESCQSTSADDASAVIIPSA